jgi:hypothetical protein
MSFIGPYQHGYFSQTYILTPIVAWSRYQVTPFFGSVRPERVSVSERMFNFAQFNWPLVHGLCEVFGKFAVFGIQKEYWTSIDRTIAS